jgi:hypothetical protein
MEVSGHLYTPATLPVGEVISIIIISPSTAEVWMFITSLVSLSLVKNDVLGCDAV